MKNKKNKDKKNKRGEIKQIMYNVIKFKGRLYTKNLIPNESVYGEALKNFEGINYRYWDAKKSKIAAAILKGLKFELKPEYKVLYLGAASGTTVSHLSDILTQGKIFAVDIAPRVLAKLVLISEKRKNIYPILGDANKPLEYSNILTLVDVVFQDVAQKNQVEIFIKNVKLYLKDNGFAMMALKTRSIDISKSAKQIHDEVLKELRKYFKSVEFVNLEPYEKDHYFYICKGFNKITQNKN